MTQAGPKKDYLTRDPLLQSKRIISTHLPERIRMRTVKTLAHVKMTQIAERNSPCSQCFIYFLHL